MAAKRKALTDAERERMKRELDRDRATRAAGYRSRALALFPHICASCAREFSGKRLKELEVHHKDHDHSNNPPDGSNWELLCIYCHDHEHEKTIDAKYIDGRGGREAPSTPGLASPFDQLDTMMDGDSASD